MRISAPSRVQLAARQLRGVFFQHGRILIYHRVGELGTDPQLLSVSPPHFGEHLEVLQKYYLPLSLQKFASQINAGNLPTRGVAVTFDDGYADNLYFAKPILQSHAIPATVFISGLNIGSSYEFWWDELERIFLQPGKLPAQIRLAIAGKKHSWDLGVASDYSQKDFDQYCTWNILDGKDPTPRQALYRSLCQLLHPLPHVECQKILEELRSLANMPRQGRATQRSLSPDEILQLAEGGLMEVGAHTMTHPVLSELPIAIQQEEICKNKQQLEEILGSRVKGFSYPYGSKADYSKGTIRLVQESGFEYACSNFPGGINRRIDLFQLPRFIVRDWDGDEFYHQLATQLW